MAHSGIGLWISLRNNSIVCLYHTETFRHLQDINVASNVSRILGNNHDSRTVKVTTLAASKGLLWVGTNTGIALTIPLPRLEGVPIISGRANVSYHAHSGPITFFLTLQIRTRPVLAPPAISVVTQPQPRETIQEESENELASSHLEINGKSTANNRATQFNTVPKVRTASVESPLKLCVYWFWNNENRFTMEKYSIWSIEEIVNFKNRLKYYGKSIHNTTKTNKT